MNIARLAALVLLVCLACTPAAQAAPRVPAPGTRAPHVLPARGAMAAAAGPRTWLVGTRPGRRAARAAARYGAERLSARGTYAVARDRARGFASALKAAGVYRWAEPNRRLAAQQAPVGGDDYAATDWRGAVVAPGLAPPPVAQAPLIAAIDSAADLTHPDLTGVRVVGDPAIEDGHGTSVASVAAGRANRRGMVGLYPGAPLLSVGTPLDVAAVTRSIAASVAAGARVINLSLGGPSPSYAMYVEIAYAVSQNVLVVASAGNDRDTQLPDGSVNPVMYPAAFPHVMSVSSMGPSGASSSFSTANGAVDVAAPGESVLAAVPFALDADGYERVDGTSFSAPIVAGAAAWLLAARPAITAAQAADLLRYTASDIAPPGWDEDSGYGTIDMGAALAGEEPAQDTGEVNDDIEWVDGRRFSRPDPLVFRARSRRRRIDALVDVWKDRADVFRIRVAGRRRVRLTLRMPRRADADLVALNARGHSIYRRRGRIGLSVRGPGKTDRVTIRNRRRGSRLAYVGVFVTGAGSRLDVPYRLVIERRR